MCSEVVTLALDADDGQLALGTLVALDRYWFVQPGEALARFTRALDLRDQVPPSLAAHALRVAGTTAWFCGQPDRTLDYCRQGLTIFEQLGDKRGISLMYTRMASPLMVEGKVDEAAELLESAATLHRQLGQEHELAIVLNLIAWVNQSRGDLTTAADLYHESVALSRKVGDSWAVSASLDALADVALEMGDFEQGMVVAREALEIAWANRDLMVVAYCFGRRSVAASCLGDSRSAAMFWGAAERLDDELGPTMWRNDKRACEARLSPEVLADKQGLAEGRALTTTEAVERALLVRAS